MNEKQLTFEILSLSMHLIILSIMTLLNLQNVLSDKLNYNIKIGSQITSITFQAFKIQHASKKKFKEYLTH